MQAPRVVGPRMCNARSCSLSCLRPIGAVTAGTVKLYLLGLPALLAGLGLRFHGKLDAAAFRKLPLVLLLLSGITLTVAQGGRSFGLLAISPSPTRPHGLSRLPILSNIPLIKLSPA